MSKTLVYKSESILSGKPPYKVKNISVFLAKKKINSGVEIMLLIGNKTYFLQGKREKKSSVMTASHFLKKLIIIWGV